ncbi:hypothetical protein Mapa_001030 [Marchantia paleacea]|nr:hypothetical protein Mapa_001030 [Marchantia paleacea]
MNFRRMEENHQDGEGVLVFDFSSPPFWLTLDENEEHDGDDNPPLDQDEELEGEQ